MKLIHFGNIEFNHSYFKKIKNEKYWNKPLGGLWTSPFDSEYGWFDWCKSEGFRLDRLDKFFVLNIKTDKILTIDSLQDLKNCLKDFEQQLDNTDPFFNTKNTVITKVLDYEKLSNYYDAIHLTVKGEGRTRLSNPHLYGWDCETVLILNKHCILDINCNEIN